MKAVQGIGRIGGAVLLALVAALAAVPAATQNWNEGPSPKEYRDFISGMNVGGTEPLDRQFWFQAGMMVGLQAAKEEYAKAGAKPLFCLPADLQPIDLRDLILAELDDNVAAWRAPDATSEKIVLHVVRRKFPC